MIVEEWVTLREFTKFDILRNYANDKVLWPISQQILKIAQQQQRSFLDIVNLLYDS